jgi:type VI secretion system protein ImpJ
MSWDNKVVWSEGMFLRAQHFQQLDRYVERLVRGRVDGLRSHSWGIGELNLNRELLAIGKFAVTSCGGILQDGTPFSIPDDADHPPPLAVPENTRNCIVYLALPVRQPGAVEVAANDSASGAGEATPARYTAVETQVIDTVTGPETEAPVQVGKLRLRYLLATSERAGYVCLGLARITEVRADKNIVLDDHYIAPCLGCAAQQPLLGFLAELQGLLHHRGEEVAGRLGAPGAKSGAEIQDFLLLQIINRYEPVIAHFHAGASGLHPESLFAKIVEIAGDLATFTKERKRTAAFPAYNHADLQASFTPVIADLRQSLSAVLDPNAVPIPLEKKAWGIWVAVVADRTLFTGATFVLTVKADVPAEMIRRNFPTQVKVGPVELIKRLVEAALPGIALSLLPVAPRQLPFYGGAFYFELNRANAFWKQMQQPGGAGALTIHVPDNYPGLDLELWAIKM